MAFQKIEHFYDCETKTGKKISETVMAENKVLAERKFRNITRIPDGVVVDVKLFHAVVGA